MGLIQIFERAPCPPQMARHLLDQVLKDWRRAGRR